MSKFYDLLTKGTGQQKDAAESSGVNQWLEEVVHAEAPATTAAEPAGGNGNGHAAGVAAAISATEKTSLASAAVALSPKPTQFRAVTLRGSERTLVPGSAAQHDLCLDAYRTLRTRLVRKLNGKESRVVMVTSAGPVEGKTTTSINLALSWAQLSQQRVLLIDGDLRSAGLSKELHLPTGAGLSDILAGSASYDCIMATNVPNMFVLQAGAKHSSPPEQFSSAEWKKFAAWAGSEFDVVIIDCPPALLFPECELIASVASGVLAVARERKTDSAKLKATIAQIDARKFLGVVFNCVAEKPLVDYYGYKYYMKNQ